MASKRYMLDFGSANAGQTPTFLQFKDLATLNAIQQPIIYEIGNGTYYFDVAFPIAGALTTTTVVFKATCNGVSLSGTVSSAPPNTNSGTLRYVLDFGDLNFGLAPTFLTFQDLATLANLTAPSVTEIGNGLYYFPYSLPVAASPTTTSINFVAAVNVGLPSQVNLSDVLSADAVYSQAGGPNTLAGLRATIRSECDIENDPHITDSDLNSWINASRFDLYGILVTRFGEDYYTASAQIPLDGQNQSFPLPDGFKYASAQPYFKGLLAELIQGPNATPNSPVSLHRFNFREKNRYNLPGFSAAEGPYLYPKYTISGSNIMFSPLPAAGLVVQIWYAPKLPPLVNDADVADDWNGWLEYVIVDVCIKAMGKQERDPGLFAARKAELKARVEYEAANRNLGDPPSVVETESYGSFGPGPFGMWG